MKLSVPSLISGRLQRVLIASFSLVAGLTVALNTFVTSRGIQAYLTTAESALVDRDMQLARTFYQLKLDEIAAISYRLALDTWVIQYLKEASQGNSNAIRIIDQQITNKISVLALGGTHLIALLDPAGTIVAGRVLSSAGDLSAPISGGTWANLPIVADAFSAGKVQSATEIIPAEFLTQVGLEKQASIALKETPLAAPEPFNPQEGSAGLALTGVYPVYDASGIIGTALSVYLFNNDFTLVDRIKAVAGIDTVTIFFGDLRIATNVMTENNERAVGTRISMPVRTAVLEQGRSYVGRAYVVNEWFITRYEPLRDRQGRVVGSIYVGARESAFLQLVNTFNRRAALIALICIVLAGIIAVPISRVITRPIDALVQATKKLAQGDMSVRVKTDGRGEWALLGNSFNSMVEQIHNTEKELLQKEKLASMGQLAAGVAHEINNPLGTILLFADVLSKELPEGDPKRDDLKMIRNETIRCKNIVSDLLNFARQQEVLAQDTNLHDLLEQATRKVSHQDSFKNVTITRSFSNDPLVLQADQSQLMQVFVNLLNNAAEAISGFGTITIATRTPEKGWVAVTVSDTGCGIREEHLEKLFTPFFTTKPIGKGTGLGLSIVYGIIKMHRGQIAVKSTLGQGTTFTVTLPMQQRGFDTPASAVTPRVIM
jgi:two-component system NtrC family sensor kinase